MNSLGNKMIYKANYAQLPRGNWGVARNSMPGYARVWATWKMNLRRSCRILKENSSQLPRGNWELGRLPGTDRWRDAR